MIFSAESAGCKKGPPLSLQGGGEKGAVSENHMTERSRGMLIGNIYDCSTALLLIPGAMPGLAAPIDEEVPL